MGYRSDVRIRLTKEDYEELKTGFNVIAEKFGYNMFDKENMDIYEEEKDVNVYKVDNNDIIDEIRDCVYFGWNWVKWYDDYPDVEYITNKIQTFDHYAFCRIGESLEGDIENIEKGMNMISFSYSFDEG